jgi:UDP-glucose 4-epimerase
MRELKHVLILGGTGTLGTALLDYFKEHQKHLKVTVASRSEHKQAELKKIYPHVKFSLCDIRESEDVMRLCHRMDVVIHVAALKHVDILEENPLDSIKTNILGTINVQNACIANDVPYCLFSSSDKAVDPVNVYGASKFISERLLLNANDRQNSTKFNVFRWGNVVGSQGSAIPYFIKAIIDGNDVTVTDPNMSRFWIKIDDAAKFMWDNFKNSSNSVLIPQGMKAATVLRVIDYLGILIGKPVKKRLLGIRAGEKISEALMSSHSRFPLDSAKSDQYSDSELLELLRPTVRKYVNIDNR